MQPPGEPRLMFDMSNKVVLITGGTSGIGLETARAFARANAAVVISGRCDERLKIACATFAKEGLDVHFYQADVRVESDVKALIGFVTTAFGRIDYAFNNAGIGGGKLIWEQDEQQFDDIIATNTKGIWLCLKHQINAMRAMNIQGAIVNNLSVHAQRTVFHGVSAYSASKHAGIALTKSAAFETASAGIRVNAIAPGPIATDMFKKSFDVIGGSNAWLSKIPLKRIGQPTEISSAVLWLCSEQSSYITGEVLTIDGGFLAA